ncbi:Phage portal protein, SPP1 Gp6-like [Popillia japonica]|uniref:Phage portal protein, SPP1 Gp6-like n=1 Tax=Popillia japonica TaxID=7064 RepID=A0AAW1HSW6_POPJA
MAVHWQEFLDENQSAYKKTATNAIAKGIGWQYITILDGKLKLTDIDPEELYPDWTDKTHEELLGIVRDYVVIEYNQGNVATDVHHVDFYDESELTPFLDKSGTGLLAPNGEPIPYLRMGEGEDSISIGWEKVPFVALKGTDDEVPMLNIIKDAVDTYDKLISKASDSIMDDTDPVLVLKGHSTAEDELRRARAQMKTNKIVAVGDSGDVGYVSVDINVDAVHKHLEVLKKQIQYDGQMVDTQDVQFGSNLSGVALQSLYSNLDIYINGFESEFRAYVQRLKPFFDAVLQYQGIGTAEQWAQFKVTVTFNRDMLINLAADIESTVKLASTGVSQQTIDEFNPVVQSHEIEEERRQAERDAAQGGDDNPVFLQEVEAAAQRLIEQRESQTTEE